MPYLNEYASNQANQNSMSDSDHVARLKQLKLKPKFHSYQKFDSVFVHTYPFESKLENVFIIDGSKYETEVDEFHSSRLALFNINQAHINIKSLQNYVAKDFPTPQEFQSINTNYSVQIILPTEGFANDEYENENDFFRYSLFKTLQTIENPALETVPEVVYRETLLGTLTHLLSISGKGDAKTQPCVLCNRLNHQMSLKDFKDEDGKMKWQTLCKCKENPKEVYITDFLCLHEQLNNETSHEALTTQAMLIFEKILFINFIRNLYLNHQYDFISKSAFILDGSLAIYSHASWLSTVIHKELVTLQEKQKIIILGVEKTGSFVDHVNKVENHYNQTPGANQSIFAFDDKYIKKYIKTYDNDNYYGEKTHFGKKIYYKNKIGARFIINIAYSSEEDKTILYNERNNQEYIKNIYGISDIVWLFDSFSSRSYENAFSLISFAHSGAALSTSVIGKNLLDKFLRTIIK